ncbi:MAG: DUF4097 family beta strand repeat-containing protein [Bacillota bacterium]
MKRKFLSELERYLAPLNKEERNEIIRFYEERFQSGMIYENKTESEIIDELESPKQIALNVLEEYGYDLTNLEKDKTISQDEGLNWGRIVLLGILDFFIVVALVPALFGIIVGLTAGWGGLIYIVFTPTIHNTTAIFNLVLIGIAILWLFILFWLYDVVISVITWIIRSHLKVFNHKDPSKVLKTMHRIKLSAYLKRHSGLRRTKNLIVTFAFLAIFVGGITSIVTYGSLNNMQFNQPINTYEASYDMTDEIALAEKLNIDIAIYTSDIEFIISDTEEIIVYVKERENLPIDILYNEDDYTLSITQEGKPVFSWDFITQIFQEKPGLIIEIPRNLKLQSALIKSYNGNIDITNIDLTNNLDIHLTNGEISLNNVVANNLIIDLVNGRITLLDTEIIQDIDVTLTNGDINVRRITALNYQFENTNGDISLRDIDVENKAGLNLTVEHVNGDIQLNNVYVKSVSLQNVNGDIDFDNEDLTYIFDDIDAHTTNGNEDINVPQS